MSIKYDHYLELSDRAAKRGDWAEAQYYLERAMVHQNEDPNPDQGELPFFYGDKPPV